MTITKYFICGYLALLLLTSDVDAGLVFTVSDTTFISDGVTETTGVIPVKLVVTADGDALLGDAVLSWDLETLEAISLAGAISTVSFDSFDNGNLFENFLSVLTSSASAPYTLAGSAVMASMPPLEPLLKNDTTFFLINFSVPAGETGSFEVALDGAGGQGKFGVFNSSNPNGYSNVSVANGTITISTVPEPSSFSMLCAFICIMLLRVFLADIKCIGKGKSH